MERKQKNETWKVRKIKNTVKVNKQPTTTTKTHFPTDFSKWLNDSKYVKETF